MAKTDAQNPSRTAKAPAKEGGGIWSFVDSFSGDKIILMIVLLLIMISILAISSSTSMLANQMHTTRTSIMREQAIIAIVGLGIVFGLYNVRTKFFKWFSQLGFFLSFIMLLMLVARINFPPFVKAATINSACRVLTIFGFQLHVYEFVKIFMVIYLAWAVSAYQSDSFSIANLLAQTDRFAFMGSDLAKKIIYIYAPVLLVTLMIMDGSISSALFIGLVMGVTILVGGIRVRELIPVVLFGVAMLAIGVGVFFISGGKVFSRIETGKARIERFRNSGEERLDALTPGTIDFNKAVDEERQPIGAKIAVKEGLIPKGPGNSTQKYVVPVIFEDYMFAFLVEEYGFIGAFVILILYGSLLARGSRIVRYCDSIYPKTVIAGLVLLISGQALMHMLINVNLAPMTGQTLPLISHGKSSFLAFCITFGIILSISRTAEKRIREDQDRLVHIIESPAANVPAEEQEEQYRVLEGPPSDHDHLSQDLDDLEKLDTI